MVFLFVLFFTLCLVLALSVCESVLSALDNNRNNSMIVVSGTLARSVMMPTRLNCGAMPTLVGVAQLLDDIFRKDIDDGRASFVSQSPIKTTLLAMSRDYGDDEWRRECFRRALWLHQCRLADANARTFKTNKQNKTKLVSSCFYKPLRI